MRIVLLPAQNRKDIPEILESARKEFKLLPVASIDEVLEKGLL